jgi:hypothetical protein
VLIVFSVDAYLLHRTYQYFGGGALNRPFALTSYFEFFVFFFQSLLYGIVFYGSFMLVLYRGVFGRLGLKKYQSLYLTFVVFSVITFTYTIAKWRIFAYFGNQFDFSVLREIAGGKLANLFAWVSPGQFVFLFLGILFLVVNVVLVKWLSQRVELTQPLGVSLFFLLFLGWSGLVVNHFSISANESLRYGLDKQIPFLLLDKVLSYATDFDGDGFSAVSRPPDPDNWNYKIHPYALDIPGNGIDENGLAGDLPADYVFIGSTDIGLGEISNRLNVIVIVVETFRTDVLAMEIDENPVMPFLRSLGEKYAYTDQAYSNFGVTGRAIQTVFAGNLHFKAGDQFLFDVFRDAGYRTYAISAQPESWGDSENILRLHDLDYFWDTRQINRDNRKLTTWQRMHPESLNANWQEVNDEIFRVLNKDESSPFFLYVNYQELHYPYFNDSMKKFFIETPNTDAGFFSAENHNKILRQYANAARNLDQAFENLFQFLTDKNILNNTLVVIVGDHPDSFYENGLLGHGWTLDHHQRKTPLIVVNGRGVYETPIGQDEIAEIILNTIRHPDRPQLKFSENSGKKVFVLGGSLDRPKKIGFIDKENLTSFDFTDNLFQLDRNGPQVSPGNRMGTAEKNAFNQLIYNWELELLKQNASPVNGAQNDTHRIPGIEQ